MSKTEAKVKCRHCGTAFTPKAGEEYCCQGCAYVARLRRENGFEHFYELRGSQALPPVGSRVFQKGDFSWLAAAVAEAEAEATTAGGNVTATFRIQGLSCVGCVWNVEKLFGRQPGAVDTRIDAQAHRIVLTWRRGEFDAVAFATALKDMGYTMQPAAQQRAPAGSTSLGRKLGMCGAFLLNTMLFTLPVYLGLEAGSFLTPLFQALAALFATLSMAVGGTYFIRRAWKAARLGVVHIDLPIALGLVAAYVGSLAGWAAGYSTLVYFDFVATFIFLMLGGRWLQEYALERNQAHLDKQDPAPQAVTACGGERDGERIPVGDVAPGTAYTLAPGEVNPVAADLLDDDALISLEWINGEADPLPLAKGRLVPAGAINVGLGGRRVQAREAWADSLLARLLERPEGPPTGATMQRVLQVYLVAVLVMAAGGCAAWWLLTGDILKSAQVLISVLVVSCPCSLGVALPTADEFAINRLRRAGLFIKHSGIWAGLAKVRVVVFDKTGTLTMDTPELRNPAALTGASEQARCALFALVKDNLHPVARCLRAALLADEASWRALRRCESQFGPVTETVGQGVHSTDAEGHTWTLGKESAELRVQSAEWPKTTQAAPAPAPSSDLEVRRSTFDVQRSPDPQPAPATSPQPEAKSCCCRSKGTCGADASPTRPSHQDSSVSQQLSGQSAGTALCRDGALVARFEFTDDVRDDAVETVRWLRDHGLSVAILSGDAPARVVTVADALGVRADAAHGGCTPQDKAAWLDAHAPGAAMMIGDGANDSLAFNRAVCRGTPVVDRNVLESASDFFFFGRSLKCLPLLLETSQRRQRTIVRIFTLAVVYNLAAIALCLGGAMHPLLAAILMPISSIASLTLAWLGMGRDKL